MDAPPEGLLFAIAQIALAVAENAVELAQTIAVPGVGLVTT